MANDDLISRSALMKSFDIAKMVEYDETGCGVTRIAVPVQTIKDAPAIDAVPVVHARWVQEDEDAWRCTRCGALWIFIDEGPEENGARFCPVCGALMDAKEG